MSPTVDTAAMNRRNRLPGVPSVVARKPLQAGKFGGILLTILLAVAGFFRVIDARAVIDHPLLGDGQFLSLVFVPLLSLGLVAVVFVETLVAGYRGLRAESPVREQLAGRWGYVVLRVAEAGVAVVGVALMITALPVLFAESTPAPAGVGIMLLLLAIGLAILVASFLRSAAELFIHDGGTAAP